MDVKVVSQHVWRRDSEQDYVQVQTYTAPDDDTVTLATIQRIVARPGREHSDASWRIKTLLRECPMSPAQAVDLAKQYAQRKRISVVYADELLRRRPDDRAEAREPGASGNHTG